MGNKLSANRNVQHIYAINKQLKEESSYQSEESQSHAETLAQTLTFITDTSQQDEERMNTHHFALKEMFGSNFLKTIENHVDFNSSSTTTLDIGCGAGTWLMDMATEFPAAKFVGIDKETLFPQIIRPANVDFHEGDVRNGLPFEDNYFDFVQIRLFLLAFDMNEWDNCLKEVYRVLKPGGYIQWTEPKLVDNGDEIVTEFSTRVRDMLLSKNQDPKIIEHQADMLKQHGFIPKEKSTKAIPLSNHPLSKEFMFIINISLDYCKPIIVQMYQHTSDEQFLRFKKSILVHRQRSSEATWSCVVAQKPL
ncbi:S-adenosyl-L-methionine-dependent methyltransferase [Blakeslea trispora]|nr:S-adenosyl-L-methionine-dependent methyltransferase [Blakeslea trispora]